MNELDWEELSGLKEVGFHLHSPLTRESGRPVYSVIRGGRVLGQTAGGALLEPRVQIDKFQLTQALNNPHGGKTRNTMITGTPTTTPPSGEEHRLQIRLGRVTVGDKPVFEVPTESGMVRLRTAVGGKTHLAEARPGRVIRQGAPTRSSIFAAGVVFGSHGVTAIDPVF